MNALIIARDGPEPKRKDQRYSEEAESPMQRLYREWENTEDPTPFKAWAERVKGRYSSSSAASS